MFNAFEEKFIRNDSNMSRYNKINIVKDIIEKHEYDKLISRLLIACFDYIDDKYKIYISTNDDYCIVKVNEMGIKFHLDFDENYIRELESLFLEDNYEYKYYDIYYFKNLCNMDIREIKRKYPNIRACTIRSVLMYIEKEKLDETFTYLNDKTNNFQSDYCKLITPVIIDMTTEKEIYSFNIFTGCILNGDKFYQYNRYDNLNVYEYVWKVDSEMLFLDKGYYLTINTKYIEVFNTYFDELVNKYKDMLDDNSISILSEIKKCCLNHIPEPIGSINRESIYRTISYDVGDYDREAACCFGCHTVYEDVKVGEKNVSTLDFKEDEFPMIKELIENIFNMFLNGNIDYKKLIKYKENDLILDILSSFEKGKVLNYDN